MPLIPAAPCFLAGSTSILAPYGLSVSSRPVLQPRTHPLFLGQDGIDFLRQCDFTLAEAVYIATPRQRAIVEPEYLVDLIVMACLHKIIYLLPGRVLLTTQ